MTYEEVMQHFNRRFQPLSHQEMRLLEYLCSHDYAITRELVNLGIAAHYLTFLRNSLNTKLSHANIPFRVQSSFQLNHKQNRKMPKIWRLVKL